MFNIQKFLFTTLLSLSFIISNKQDRVTFKSKDDIKVCAHAHKIDKNYSYILLFHQKNYSKRKFQEIAVDLLKLKHNCLATNLGYDGTINSIPNETAVNTPSINHRKAMCDSLFDIKAAINYTYSKSKKNVTLIDRFFSSSLAIKKALENEKSKAIIAYSPEEFFRSRLSLHDDLKEFNKPIYVTESQSKNEYLRTLTELVPRDKITLFTPQSKEGKHGAKSLCKKGKTSKENWLSLLMFINDLK